MRLFRKLLVVFLFCLAGTALHWYSAPIPVPDSKGDNINISTNNGAESDVAYDTKERFL
jgi:hypothetical protein